MGKNDERQNKREKKAPNDDTRVLCDLFVDRERKFHRILSLSLSGSTNVEPKVPQKNSNRNKCVLKVQTTLLYLLDAKLYQFGS